MQVIAYFTITTSKAGTKINYRGNGKEVKFESRQNGSRQIGNTPILIGLTLLICYVSQAGTKSLQNLPDLGF